VSARRRHDLREITDEELRHRGETLERRSLADYCCAVRSTGVHHVDLVVSDVEPVDRYRVGLHHLCLEVSDNAALDADAERVRELGARITDGPREFPEYRSGYHALFFEDPDGIKLELVWTPPGTYDYQGSQEHSGQPG
jgi:catechol-2,3-dioxygenase